jgi:hypothetical protein
MMMKTFHFRGAIKTNNKKGGPNKQHNILCMLPIAKPNLRGVVAGYILENKLRSIVNGAGYGLRSAPTLWDKFIKEFIR